jgi:predicted O-methyltransferase YrrM
VTAVCRDSETLGRFHRLCLPGETDAFVTAMGVPTFAALHGTALPLLPTVARGLEGALGKGPAFCVDYVLSKEVCRDWKNTFDELGFGEFASGKNHHGALQVVVSEATATSLGQILSRHVDLAQVEARRVEMEEQTSEQQGDTACTTEDVRLVYAGLNRRWRIYKYAPGGEESFAPHIDAGFPPSGLSDDETELVWDANHDSDERIVSRLTVLFYLNDDFVGGETKFYQPAAERAADSDSDDPALSVIASIRPVTGSCLVFPQGVGEEAVEYARQCWPLHEGSPVASGNPKYVIRSDILFAEQREKLPLDETLFQYDHLVRDTFALQSAVVNKKFASHLKSLYNPHMGVENMGPFLYSFLRLVKRRQIVEIGAGYTSAWILQALHDNDEELERIRTLQRAGQCRLLDYPWTVGERIEAYDEQAASLLCIDNCEHQKETATGAAAIAKSLGLDPYFSFLQCDAFDLALENASIDVLWCDFGAGARMKEFAAGAWASIRPGGFLLCHSSLTNTNTRDWLETVRSQQGEDITGLPSGEYVELSLLEPHKRYQNSISIIQKRQGYEEPLYSNFA